MPNPWPVDRATFTALCLSQAAISAARASLRYGSANQYVDLLQMRTGGNPDGQTLPRLKLTRAGTDALYTRNHAPLPAYFNKSEPMYIRAISAGVAMFYGAGNCGEHANLTFTFLCTFGFPGIEVTRVSGSTLPNGKRFDHAYTMINWKGCKDPVVCDAWPTTPQACLWSHFFGNMRRTKPDPGFIVNARYDIVDMGNDIVGDAFRAVDPARVAQLPPQQQIKGYPQDQINKRIEEGGAYNHTSVLAGGQAWLDYVYVNEKNQAELMSKAAPVGEQWTGKVLPVIAEVNNRLPYKLDASKRYVGEYTGKAV